MSLEYNEMAKYYDTFYNKKNYNKEINFILDIIGARKNILDVGCGTGIHMSLLESNNKYCDGIDLNSGMIDIAKKRVNGKIYNGNLLNYSFTKKYDVIISMFAVFNHLKSIDEFEIGIQNLMNYLNDDGILIIDLHNGSNDGFKIDELNGLKRKMSWSFNMKNRIETTDIEYIIGDNIYKDRHIFYIPSIQELKNLLDRLSIKYYLYENYSKNIANEKSKNIEIVIYK